MFRSEYKNLKLARGKSLTKEKHCSDAVPCFVFLRIKRKRKVII